MDFKLTTTISMTKINIFFATFLLISLFGMNSFAQESTEINKVLSEKRAYNKENPSGKGFKIQLYNGDETSAYRIQKNFEIEFDMKAVLKYETPEWKVRVGNFKTRLEADRVLLEIKQKYSGAIVLQTEIKL